ncbi:MAG: hypothetical protein WC836_20830, partial [Desulfobacula sp.]
MKKISLAMKLNSICIGLVIIPLLILGGVALRSLISFSDDVTGMTSERLKADAEKSLIAGAMRDRDEILGFVRMIESDTLKMATSGILMSYIEAETEQNELHRDGVESIKIRLQQELVRTNRIAKVMTPSGEKTAYPQVR